MVKQNNTRPVQRSQTREAQPPNTRQVTDAQITPEAFNALYESVMQTYSHWTFEKIYEETERQVQEKFGARKYASADSFRQIRKRLIRK